MSQDRPPQGVGKNICVGFCKSSLSLFFSLHGHRAYDSPTRQTRQVPKTHLDFSARNTFFFFFSRRYVKAYSWDVRNYISVMGWSEQCDCFLGPCLLLSWLADVQYSLHLRKTSPPPLLPMLLPLLFLVVLHGSTCPGTAFTECVKVTAATTSKTFGPGGVPPFGTLYPQGTSWLAFCPSCLYHLSFHCVFHVYFMSSSMCFVFLR